MKELIFLLALVLTSCATSYRIDPSRVSFAVAADTSQWERSTGKVDVPVEVKNDSRAMLQIGVEASPGIPAEPVRISWLYYQVLSEDGHVNAVHGPGGHGPMPPNTLRVDPGDSATLIATIYGLAPGDCSRRLRIRFQDLEGNSYTTGAFAPCAAQ